MNGIEDERIKFYLEHEDRIKEWAAIKHKVCEFAHGFYLTLKDRIDEELRERSSTALDGITSVGPTDKRWMTVGLRREEWQRDDGSRLAIGIQWDRKHTGFDGYLVCGASNGGVPVARPLRSIFQPVVDAKGAKSWMHGVNWFVYRNLQKPKRGFWEASDGLANYQDYLVEQLFTAWGTLAPLVDKAVEAQKTVTPQA